MKRGELVVVSEESYEQMDHARVHPGKILLIVPKDEVHLYYDKNINLSEIGHISSGLRVVGLFSSEIKEEKISVSKVENKLLVDQSDESSVKKEMEE